MNKVFTYTEQPCDNVIAWRLGEACRNAAKAPGGDYIDGGLSLLKELQEKGFGVVALDAQPAQQDGGLCPSDHPETRVSTGSEGGGIAQQDAPTDPASDAEIFAVFERHTKRDSYAGGTVFVDYLGAAKELLRRYAPAQDAERERDSERYRALVESGAYSPGRFPSCPWGLRTGNEKATKAELDEAVDAARAKRAPSTVRQPCSVSQAVQMPDNQSINWTQLIREIMAEGVTQAEIGASIGMSQSAVSQYLAADGKRDMAHSKGQKLLALHARVCAAAAMGEKDA
ncbi:hypothetical protein CAL14_05350 [Bordetella genomosp. 9]|uniref:hypothetical protein n=1 Tax=Bordetella genomosp. 9 TaxID=1416803 RepID=UPI000A296E97|nr:hypothetical protein [Bordetella genomosp. 9]ARP89781.1 hypothetical protein CAL14_05350 [Bordetella genomosp. 9]